MRPTFLVSSQVLRSQQRYVPVILSRLLVLPESSSPHSSYICVRYISSLWWSLILMTGYCLVSITCFVLLFCSEFISFSFFSFSTFMVLKSLASKKRRADFFYHCRLHADVEIQIQVAHVWVPLVKKRQYNIGLLAFIFVSLLFAYVIARLIAKCYRQGTLR